MMIGPSTLADFEDLVPAGTAAPGDWLRALADQVESAPAVDKVIGGVKGDPAEVETARIALVEWAEGVPETDPRKILLRRDLLHWLLRPALRIARGPEGLVPDDVAPPVWGAQAAVIRRLVQTHGPSVGRLDVEADGVRSHVGTAWVVGSAGDDWVLLTAGHVVRDANDFGWVDGSARVLLDFDCLDGPSATTFVASAPEIHPSLDLAIVRIARAAAPQLAPLPLDAGGPEPLVGHPALVLGHPAFVTEAQTVFATTTVGFDGKTGLKRASPGRLRAATTAIDNVRWKPAFAHDATTLGGNSGSPVLSLVTERVVGLHVGGKPSDPLRPSWFVDNYALPTWLLPADAILSALRKAVPDLAAPGAGLLTT
jgi:hypothetical protein